jgi:galactoside O-acetyltransferase
MELALAQVKLWKSFTGQINKWREIMSSFCSEKELSQIGFIKYGKNVLLSRNACIYGADRMSIGENVRIDDFCILSGNIVLGDHIHIAPYCLLAGGTEGIFMEDFSGLSSRVSIYAVTDDYSGNSLTNPTIPNEYKNIISKRILIGKHVIIGASSTILPGSDIPEGVSVGCMSLVNKPLEPWFVYAGIPCKIIKMRQKELLNMERKYNERKSYE